MLSPSHSSLLPELVRSYPVLDCAVKLLIFSFFLCIFLAHGYLMFIFMQSYSSLWVQSCCLLFFVRQQKFEFIVTLNGCIYGAKCCRYCAFMFALIHYMNFCTAGLALKAKKKCLLPVGIFSWMPLNVGKKYRCFFSPVILKIRSQRFWFGLLMRICRQYINLWCGPVRDYVVLVLNYSKKLGIVVRYVPTKVSVL